MAGDSDTDQMTAVKVTGQLGVLCIAAAIAALCVGLWSSFGPLSVAAVLDLLGLLLTFLSFRLYQAAKNSTPSEDGEGR